MLFQPDTCLKRLLLKSPKSKMFTLLSVAIFIVPIIQQAIPEMVQDFCTHPTINGFVLESVISTQKHFIASMSKSDLRLTLFPIDLWTYRAGPVCKGNHYHDAKQRWH